MKHKNCSWLTLVVFCTTASLVAAFGLALLFASATLGLAFAESLAHPSVVEANTQDSTGKTYSGVITDSHCGARHMDSSKSPAECTRMCVRNGSKYTLIDGDKRYALQGQENNLDKLAGERAKIGGALDGDTIKVSSVIPGDQ
jgi:hypothetical protein